MNAFMIHSSGVISYITEAVCHKFDNRTMRRRLQRRWWAWSHDDTILPSSPPYKA